MTVKSINLEIHSVLRNQRASKYKSRNLASRLYLIIELL